MYLSRFSIVRPVAMTSFVIVLLLAGLNSYRKLGLDNMPSIDIPNVTVTVLYPGASPSEIEVDVAKRIEDTVSTIDGLKHIKTTCMQNLCQIVLEFNLDVNVDVAAADVREKVDLVLDDFPEGAEKPKVLKFDINAIPIATLLLHGDMPIDQIYDYADEILSDRLSIIKGVAEVQIAGGEELEVHLTINEERLGANGLTVADVISFLAQNNMKIPSGSLREGKQEVTVTFDSEFQSLDELRNLEIKNSQKGRLYVRDIADVELISKEERTRSYFNGAPCISIKVVKKGEANAVNVVKRIRETVTNIKNSGTLPGALKLEVFRDDGEYVTALVNDAWYSIFLGILLTAGILLIFLHEIRSTLIICLSMPTSIIITLWGMKLFGYTMNTITLLALGTSIGILVANSLVVIENIIKKLQQGQDPTYAADKGTAEVALPVFASASTNIVVFIPIALMTSLVGKFFVPFAVTMTVATLASLFVSFTITPMFSSIFLTNRKPKHFLITRFFIRIWEFIYGSVQTLYSRTLGISAIAPWAVLLLIFAVFVATFVWIVPHVGLGFFPDSDRGEFVIKIEYPTDININENTRRTLAYAARIRRLPHVLRTSTVIGKVQGIIGQVSEGVHLAEVNVVTTSKLKRKETLEQLRNLFRNEFKDETNCIVTVNIRSVVGGSSSDLEVDISGQDLDTLETVMKQAVKKLEETGKLTDIDSNVRPGKPELKVLPKRTVLQDLNIPSMFLGTVLRGNIEGIKIGTFKQRGRSFDIRVELEEKEGINQVSGFTVGSQNGKPLNIEVLANIEEDTIPIQIVRSDKSRTVKLFANPAPGLALGDAVKLIRKTVGPLLPPGYSLSFAGKVERMQEAAADFGEALLTAAILTYLLIAAIMESWSRPFIILFTLPLALIGLFGALYLASMALSMMALLGAIMLIGIVVNNAILIMDQVAIYRQDGMDPVTAMLKASEEKFRPIVMTSVAAVLGIVPMAFGQGLGSELRASCGIAVFGGLISSTILSLYAIPLIYIFFVKLFAKRIAAEEERKRNSVESVASAPIKVP